MNEMVARVQSLIRRYTTLNEFRQEGQSNLEIGGLSINAMNREVYIGGKPIELTAKEFDLLYFWRHIKGGVYQKADIRQCMAG
jgi:DNA-binding response OmpR family regulator